MNQRKPRMLAVVIALCSVWLIPLSCVSEREDPFAIVPGRVGKLVKTHRISDLDSIYAADSLVRDTTRLQFGNNGKVEVFEKGGAHLLTLSPGTDSIPGIGNIRIRDPRFQTSAGIGLNSTFGDIEKAYEIRKVISSRNNILVLLKEEEVYFTISREELPGSIRYNDAPVEAVQIPEAARIKYMMVDWE